MDAIKEISNALNASNAQYQAGMQAERNRLTRRLATEIDQMTLTNNRIKEYAKRLHNDDYHTITHMTEMFDVCLNSLNSTIK